MRVTTRECAIAEKPWPPYSFGMIMPKKPVAAQEHPDACRQIALLVDLPVVQTCAQFLHRAIHEGLLVCSQPLRRESQQLFPLRTAGEKLGVPPYRAGFQRDSFGFTQARQHRCHQFHGETRD